MMRDNIITANNINIAALVKALLAEEVVALPSETVYGLAADATSNAAVKKIYNIKNRPSYNPLIIHVCDIAMVREYCIVSEFAYYLMHYFWPGALTLVLPLKAKHQLAAAVTAGLTTVAVRSPKGLFNKIIKDFGKPLAAPSANKSGGISPTNAMAVAQDIGDKLDLIVDGGACEIGIESTIVKLDGNVLRILRHGGITKEALVAALKAFNATSGLDPIILGLSGNSATIEAPGMLSSHYAPRSLMRLGITEIKTGEVLLAFGQQQCAHVERALKILNLSKSGNLKEAALNLYYYLKCLDACNPTAIAVQNIPQYDLGVAINDRLARAAAPRI
ncbi:L-threonylcarbamoyladenylate synthase [Bartonella sp. TP]|uniref:L-threonylcarbamoyladenylate synthase n=1 Tax=Bartonella sp. TP TaxID=3057550 RepID=UPI0025B20E61|nr:L-threonylcarbamoyladenylate synthase [Bartonella sp. TP]MDN5248794.1 L-threonylcarbamoyladenylate synthase [Alphaproteobacteria bacterium]WJW80208.1 L-threonylcarbamoyladenylate synthase [Bartonella sp. TP]